jgi:hypothetical protein
MIYLTKNNGNFIVPTSDEIFFLNKKNQYCYKSLTGLEMDIFLKNISDYQTIDVEIKNDFVLGKLLPKNSKERILFELNIANKKISSLHNELEFLKSKNETLEKIKTASSFDDVQAILLGFNNHKHQIKENNKIIANKRRGEIKKSIFNKILTKEEKKYYIDNGNVFCSENILKFFKSFAFNNIDFGRRKYYSMGENCINPQFRDEHRYDYRKGKSKKIVNSVYTLIADFFVLERENEIIYLLPNQELKSVTKPNLPPSLKYDNWDIVKEDFDKDIYRIIFNPFYDLKKQLIAHKEHVNVLKINETIILPELEKELIIEELKKCSADNIEHILKENYIVEDVKNVAMEILDYKLTPFFQQN